MKKNTLRMGSKKFTIIWSSVLAVLLVLIIGVTATMNFFALSMEIFLGRGEQIVSVPENVAAWDTDYYTTLYTDGDDLMKLSQGAALAVAEEGAVLLKNNNVLPLTRDANVTPFGYRYMNPVYGGGGSGNVNTDSPHIVSAQSALNRYFSVNATMEQALGGARARGLDLERYDNPNEQGGFEGATHKIIELSPAVYGGLEASCANTTAIVFVGRVGGEGRDLLANVEGSPLYGKTYFDGTEHQLQLSEDEKAMIRFANTNCENTVVILNTSNVMEIDALVDDKSDLAADAILWIGSPGGQGMEAMAKILCGEVNPSGRTVDIWMKDIMSDPVMSNFGNFSYDNLMMLQGGYPTPVGEATEMNLIEYEENVYLGYRFYETVHSTGGTFSAFGQTGLRYGDAVQFPFGYGLSYGTDFAQTITALSEDDNQVTINVRVANNGTQAGKDVVQVYVNPPYTQFDIDNRIEKATANLITFGKTGVLQPGSFEDMTLSFSKEDMASYCYARQNPDGTVGAYVLENGDYEISINKNSHEQYEVGSVNVGSTVWYDSTNPRQSEVDAQSILDAAGNPTNVPLKAEENADATYLAASNRFQALSDHMENTNQLTRANGPLVNTATVPRADERTAPAGVGTDDGTGTMTMQHMNLATDETLGNVPGSKVYTDEMPITDADNGLALASLRGLSYYDPLWDSLLDQLDLTETSLYVALAASYNQTAQIESISKPATVDYDGPQGIVGSITDSFEYTAYPSEPIWGSTFNRTLAYDMGVAVGQEAISAGVHSWYAPAMNIHRSPFSGRNFEYYSEDPILSGFMAAGVVSGCSDQGLITTIKHYAINDQELYDNDRSRVATWVNEQAMREIYFRPFEIAIKEAKMTVNYIADNEGTVATKVMRGATGVMNCMNYLGYTWGGSSYALNTELLRDEWGFQGMVITDMVMNAGSNSVDQCLRAGSDTWMAWGDAFTTLIEDNTSPTGVATIRRAVKNMSYAVVNSRAMDGIAPGTVITYKTSPWKIGLTAANVVVYGFIVAMAGYIIVRAKDAKKNPEKYEQPKGKNRT